MASWRNYDLEPIERFFYKETVSSIKKHRTPRPLIIQFTDSIMTTGEGNDHLPKRFFRAQPASTQCAVILRVLTLTTKLIGSNLAWHKMQSSDGISTSLSSCEKLEETLIEAAIFLRVNWKITYLTIWDDRCLVPFQILRHWWCLCETNNWVLLPYQSTEVGLLLKKLSIVYFETIVNRQVFKYDCLINITYYYYYWIYSKEQPTKRNLAERAQGKFQMPYAYKVIQGNFHIYFL